MTAKRECAAYRALHLAQLYFRRRYATGPYAECNECDRAVVRRYCDWRNKWINECWSMALKIDAGAPKPTFFKVIPSRAFKSTLSAN